MPVTAARLQGIIAGAPKDSVSTVSDAQGRYCIRLRSAGELLLQIEAEGFIARSLLLTVAVGIATRVDVQLAPAIGGPVQLDPIVARAPGPPPQAIRRGAPPGADLSSRSSGFASQFPGAPGDLISSLGISGQYMPVEGQGLSIEGQAPSGNRVSLDGAGYDASEVPAEGLAAAGVFAHPYDVSRGQFTGGEIVGRTMSGTNVWGGAVRLSLEPPPSAYGSAPRKQWGTHGRTVFLSGGGGGPIVPGRLFVYGAAQAEDRDIHAPSLGSGNPDQPVLGVPVDSVYRFLDVLQELGQDPGPESAGMRHVRSASMITRFDFVPRDGHSIMLRLDGRGREMSGGAGSPLGTTRAAREETVGGGVLVQLTSRIGTTENEMTFRHSTADQRNHRGFEGPAGRVWVGGDDGEVSGASLTFGGEALGFAPERRSGFELRDHVVFKMNGGHHIHLGGKWQSDRVFRSSDANRLGTFTFRSLSALERGEAVRFTRSLGERSGEVTTGYAAAFLGDRWIVSRDLRVIFGIRAERHTYSSPADTGSREITDFGLDRVPGATQWSVSPRAGITWYRNSPVTSIGLQGGIGLFRGGAPTRLLAAALSTEADEGGDLVCVGSAVPLPRWSEYVGNVNAIPTECAGEVGGAATSLIGMTGFREYGPPRVWHASLGGNWLHKPSATGAEVRVGFSQGLGHPLAVDRNLALAPAFVLASEGRPVFVPLDGIDAASGQASPQGSRRDGQFGVVREISAAGGSQVGFLSLGLNRITPHGLVEVFYTYTRSRNQGTGLAGLEGGWATTSGDPRVAEWASSDFEQRHAIQVSWLRRLGRWGSTTVVGHLRSGTPYTPIVDGDVNGDGLDNDRAYVFDPRTTPDLQFRSELAAFMDQLPGSSRACLLGQMGRIAARNSCRTPWNMFLDLQLNIFPGGPRNKRVVLNVAAQNVMAGLDYLIHGRDRVRGWGQNANPDPVLLRAISFDPAQRDYRYDVNPGFGREAGRPLRSPFSLRIQARVTLGADPATQALVAAVTYNQNRLDADWLRAEMLRRWQNVPSAILKYAAQQSLDLTPGQLTALNSMADTVQLRAGEIVTELADVIVSLSQDPSGVTAGLARQRELMDEAQSLLERGFAVARSILTTQQWVRLPRNLRLPVNAELPIAPEGGIELLPDF